MALLQGQDEASRLEDELATCKKKYEQVCVVCVRCVCVRCALCPHDHEQTCVLGVRCAPMIMSGCVFVCAVPP